MTERIKLEPYQIDYETGGDSVYESLVIPCEDKDEVMRLKSQILSDYEIVNRLNERIKNIQLTIDDEDGFSMSLPLTLLVLKQIRDGENE